MSRKFNWYEFRRDLSAIVGGPVTGALCGRSRG